MVLFDLILFGATGYTGRKVLEALVSSKKKLNFAVAGRNVNKVRKLLSTVGQQKGIDLSEVPVIVADCTDEVSLVGMVKQAKIVLNTIGPYRLYGEAVVKVCVENKTNYVDVCGEPAFLERMQLKYAALAEKNNVYIIGSCGWDSIPCDLGINILKENFGGRLNYAETFIDLNFGSDGFSINTGTYQSLILSMANWRKDEFGEMRRCLMPEKLPRSGFFPPKRTILWYHKGIKAYCLPFLGADKSVVNRTQYVNWRLYNEFPVFIETYIAIKSLFRAVLLMLWFSIFSFLTRFDLSRRLLQNFPEICSFNMFKTSGPTKDQIENSSFTYWFYGYGWRDVNHHQSQSLGFPEDQIILRCDGPDASYIATAGCALSAALTLIEENEALPKNGGVFTPGTAFKHTAILDRLKEYGITFVMVEDKQLF